MILPMIAGKPGSKKQRMIRVTRFFHQRETFQISSVTVSNSETRGGRIYACTRATKNPTPMRGVSPVNGAATSAVKIANGCAPAIMAPSIAPPPVYKNQLRVTSPALSKPEWMPTPIIEAIIAAVIVQPRILKIGEDGLISHNFSSAGSGKFSSIIFLMPST